VRSRIRCPGSNSNPHAFPVFRLARPQNIARVRDANRVSIIIENCRIIREVPKQRSLLDVAVGLICRGRGRTPRTESLLQFLRWNPKETHPCHPTFVELTRNHGCRPRALTRLVEARDCTPDQTTRADHQSRRAVHRHGAQKGCVHLFRHRGEPPTAHREAVPSRPCRQADILQRVVDLGIDSAKKRCAVVNQAS